MAVAQPTGAVTSTGRHTRALLCVALCVTCSDAAGQRLGSKITQIYEGTNQVQRIVMARKLLERY